MAKNSRDRYRMLIERPSGGRPDACRSGIDAHKPQRPAAVAVKRAANTGRRAGPLCEWRIVRFEPNIGRELARIIC